MISMRSFAIHLLVVVAAGCFGVASAQRDRTVLNSDMNLVDFSDMAYPKVALAAHIEGVVVVWATLDDEGKVAEAKAISGDNTLLPDCLANAKKWRFRPNAQKAAVIVYNFRLTAGLSKSGCSHFSLLAPNFATVTGCVPEINTSESPALQ